MIGWKKSEHATRSFEVLVKLSIPKSARVVQTPKGYWRCDKARVLAITSLDGKTDFRLANSLKDSHFKYRVGMMVYSDFSLDICSCVFCGDPMRERGPGIYFFKTKTEAIKYIY